MFSSAGFVFQCSVSSAVFPVHGFQWVSGTVGLSPPCHRQPQPASCSLQIRGNWDAAVRPQLLWAPLPETPKIPQAVHPHPQTGPRQLQGRERTPPELQRGWGGGWGRCPSDHDQSSRDGPEAPKPCPDPAAGMLLGHSRDWSGRARGACPGHSRDVVGTAWAHPGGAGVLLQHWGGGPQAPPGLRRWEGAAGSRESLAAAFLPLQAREALI